MQIHYKDIAAESETVNVPLDGLDVGTSAFMNWFKEQAAIKTTIINWNGGYKVSSIMGGPLSENWPTADKNYSEFDFSSAEVINPYDEFNNMTNILFINLSDNTDEIFKNSNVNTSFASSLQKIDKVQPCLSLFHSFATGIDAKSDYADRYNLIKDTLGSDKINDPAYGISLIRIAKLDIDPSNAIDTIESISF